MSVSVSARERGETETETETEGEGAPRPLRAGRPPAGRRPGRQRDAELSAASSGRPRAPGRPPASPQTPPEGRCSAATLRGRTERLGPGVPGENRGEVRGHVRGLWGPGHGAGRPRSGAGQTRVPPRDPLAGGNPGAARDAEAVGLRGRAPRGRTRAAEAGTLWPRDRAACLGGWPAPLPPSPAPAGPGGLQRAPGDCPAEGPPACGRGSQGPRRRGGC